MLDLAELAARLGAGTDIVRDGGLRWITAIDDAKVIVRVARRHHFAATAEVRELRDLSLVVRLGDVGFGDAEVGDEAFDRRWTVRTDDPAMAALILDAPARQALEATVRPKVVAHGGPTAYALALRGGQLSIGRDEPEPELARAEAAMRVAAQVAARPKQLIVDFARLAGGIDGRLARQCWTAGTVASIDLSRHHLQMELAIRYALGAGRRQLVTTLHVTGAGAGTGSWRLIGPKDRLIDLAPLPAMWTRRPIAAGLLAGDPPPELGGVTTLLGSAALDHIEVERGDGVVARFTWAGMMTELDRISAALALAVRLLSTPSGPYR